MNDFSNELYSGTPEEIDEERREQLLQEEELKKEIEQLREEARELEREESLSATAPVDTAQPDNQPKPDFYGAD